MQVNELHFVLLPVGSAGTIHRVGDTQVFGPKTTANTASADILGLKFLPVGSEGSFLVLLSLGDLA